MRSRYRVPVSRSGSTRSTGPVNEIAARAEESACRHVAKVDARTRDQNQNAATDSRRAADALDALR